MVLAVEIQKKFLTPFPPPNDVLVDLAKAPGGWDIINSYTVVVKAAAFTAGGGFGSLAVPDQHNSPSKLGVNQITTTPTDSTVTNTATVAAVTATAPTTGVTAADTATVDVNVPTSTGNVVAGPLKFKARTASVVITNNGTSAVDISRIVLNWPLADGKLKKVKINGTVIFDTATSGGAVTISTFKGAASLRHLAPGQSITLSLEFEKNANTDASLYGLFMDLGSGLLELL